MKPRISIVGLGKLGLPIFSCFISKGFKVIGIDNNSNRLKEISSLSTSIVEPQVSELLKNHLRRNQLTTDLRSAILNSSLTFIMLPTPSETSGAFSGEFILGVCEEIGRILKTKSTYHLIVILSTIMPGTMKKIQNSLEKYSDKRITKDFGLCYSPELVAIGNIVETYLNPDFVVIGESDSKAGKKLSGIYQQLFLNNPPIIHMNYTNAEICKIALNAFITTKISFANTLAEICERIPGANVDTITSTIGQDSRIGTRFFKGGLGPGGFCFPRDHKAFSYLSSQVGVGALLSTATDVANSRQAKRIVSWVENILPKNGEVGVLGIAFKPGTNTIEESQGLKIAKEIAKKGILTRIYDSLKPENLDKILKDTPNIKWGFAVQNLLNHSDIVVIANQCKEFQDLKPGDFKKNSKVIDCWRILNASKFKNQELVKYFAVGIYNTNE